MRGGSNVLGLAWALAGAGPGFLRGGGRTAGAFLGLLNQPSSDGDTGNAIGVVSFRRVMVEIVDMVVVPVVVAARRSQRGGSAPARGRAMRSTCVQS